MRGSTELRIAKAHGEFLAKLYLDRIKGELLHKSGRLREAQALLRATTDRSMKAGARLFALAAAMGLADLQQEIGMGSDGKGKVRRILGTYTEGLKSSFTLRAQKLVKAERWSNMTPDSRNKPK